jgi:endonuclease V-like protein UPF0215 family
MNESHKLPGIEDHDRDVALGWKLGTRVLGVSESFNRSDKRSITVGVVMRGDLRMDGFGLCRPEVGGRDATEQLLSMYERIKRDDIRAWILGGGVVSWFNVVDLPYLHEATDIPVVCVSYEESEGLEKYLEEYFPDDYEERLTLLKNSGDRTEVMLKTGHSVYVISHGVSVKRATRLLDIFTVDGRIPEPVRIARSIASGLQRDLVV